MTVRSMVLMATLLLSTAGCATSGAAITATRSEALSCDGLGPASAQSAFEAPLTVVAAKRVYRYEGRARLRVPEGVALRVRAEQGLSAPDVHRLVACRLDYGAQARVGVRPKGATYEVVVSSRTPSLAREIQSQFGPSGG